MTPPYRIVNTTLADLERIYELFDQSVLYQEARGYPSWRGYDKQALAHDAASLNQYKIVKEESMAIIFSVCYADKIIWREREKGDALYLHRIVVNPAFKGQKLFGRILEWSMGHARDKHLKFVRMDTWAGNPGLIQYYQSFGFTFAGNHTTPDSPELPSHNRKLALALLELPV